jgi:SAM-dependent methyltransferase
MSEQIRKRWSEDSKLIDCWIEFGKTNGDMYRQYLINPVIYGLLIEKNIQEFPGFSLIQAAYSNWLNNIYKKNDITDDNWYTSQIISDHSRTILDLGCGEGYRGRWLKDKITKYVGVDLSFPLVAKAQESQVECHQADLNLSGSLRGVWNNGTPPDLILAITLLDQLENPEGLLKEIASMYSPGTRGKMLVVTCTPEFYGATGLETEPVHVKIRTILDDEGGPVYLRSRETVRRIFRNAGMQVIDETALPLPECFAGKSYVDNGFNLAYSPFTFWLIDITGTLCKQVRQEEIENWLQTQNFDGHNKATAKAILEHFKCMADKLIWRSLTKSQMLIRRHNLGGRLFIVREGYFSAHTSGNVFKNDSGHVKDNVWVFNENELFGELEIGNGSNSKELLYVTSVIAGSHTHESVTAKVLEIPADVAQKSLLSCSLLGNVFFNGLRKKVIDGIINNFEVEYSGRKTGGVSIPQDIQEFLARSGNRVNIEPRKLLSVVKMILTAFDEVFYHSSEKIFSLEHKVLLKKIYGKSFKEDEMSGFNLALLLLNNAGVISMVSFANPSHRTEVINIVRNRICQIQNYKQASSELSNPKLIFVKVEDELILKKIISEPSLEAFEQLFERVRLYHTKIAEISSARFNELADSITKHMLLKWE